MKRSLFVIILSALALVWSCGKDSGGNSGSGNENNILGEVESISLGKEEVDAYVNGSSAYVDVGLEPALPLSGNIKLVPSKPIVECSIAGSQIRIDGKQKGECTVKVSPERGGASSKLIKVTVWGEGEHRIVAVKSIELKLSGNEIRTNESYGEPISCSVKLTPVNEGETPTLDDLDFSIGTPTVLEVKDWNPSKGTFKLAAKTKLTGSSTFKIFPKGKTSSDPLAKGDIISIRKEIKEVIIEKKDLWQNFDSNGNWIITAGETVDLSADSSAPVTVKLKYYDETTVAIKDDKGAFTLESSEKTFTSTNGLKVSVSSNCTSHYAMNYLSLMLDGVYLNKGSIRFDIYAKATSHDFEYASCDEYGNVSGSYKKITTASVDLLGQKYYRLRAVVSPSGACQDVYWITYPSDIKWLDNSPCFYLPGNRSFTFEARTRGAVNNILKTVKIE